MSDFDYDLFHRRVLSGGIRWWASLLALISVTMFVAQLASGNTLKMPLSGFVIEGVGLLIFAGLNALLWTLLAVVNWRNSLANR